MTDNVPECTTSNVEETTSVFGPTKRTRSSLKLKRRRTTRKLKHRAARVAEETLWRDVDAATHVELEGRDCSHQHCMDTSNRREKSMHPQTNGDDALPAINQAISEWDVARIAWEKYLNKAFEDFSDAEEDRKQLEQVVRGSAVHKLALSRLVVVLRIEGMNDDKARAEASSFLENAFRQCFNSRQSGDLDSDYG